MWKRILLLLIVTLFVGCNRERKDDESGETTATRPLPPEVEHGPDQALEQYQKNQQNPWGRP